MLLVLKRSDAQESALETLLDAQQDRNQRAIVSGSPQDSFGQQFGPSDQDIQAVCFLASIAWVSTGPHFTGPGSDRIFRHRCAGAASVSHRNSNRCHYVSGVEHWANASDPQIPAALASVIEGVSSSTIFPKQPAYHLGGVFSRSRATGRITSLQPGYTVPNACGGVTCYFLRPV